MKTIPYRGEVCMSDIGGDLYVSNIPKLLTQRCLLQLYDECVDNNNNDGDVVKRKQLCELNDTAMLDVCLAFVVFVEYTYLLF
jgi:hypothetical protein